MPSRLKRFHASGQTHCVTFCCWHRKSGFNNSEARSVFEAGLERIRRRFRLSIYGYVVMPEHVHLLIGKPGCETLANAIKSLKQGVSRRLINGAPHFWEKRYYDFNIRNHRQFVEKLRYIHRNPVNRNLCARPGDWTRSSFRPRCDWLPRFGEDRIGVGHQKARGERQDDSAQP